MTNAITAIAARVAELQSQFAPPASTAAPATGSSGSFAAQLEAALNGGGSSAGSGGAASGAGRTAGSPAASTGGTGTSPITGTPGVKSKSPVSGGGSHLTARMKNVIGELDQRFGAFKSIGGWRSNGGIAGGGEHPLGRAADFMLSTGGKMPTAENQARGWQAAEWAKQNAGRLGIKYIIYDQKIWNPDRAAEGWRPMENRGSITANHKDHVHISVK